MSRTNYQEEQECDRCGDTVPADYNETPFGLMLCDDCLTMEDVFPEDDDYE